MRRRVLGSLVLLCVAGMLSSCATGDSTAAKFSDEFSSDPLVIGGETSSVDNMPFTGGVSGSLVMSPSTSDDELVSFASRVSDFARTHSASADKTMVRIDLELEEWRFPILTDPEATSRVARLALALRDRGDLEGGVLYADEEHLTVEQANVVGMDRQDVFALFDSVSDDLNEAGIHPDLTVSSSEDAPIRVLLSDEAPIVDQLAKPLFHSLDSNAQLTSFEFEKDSIRVGVRREDQANTALEILRQGVSDDPRELSVESDLVKLAPGAAGEDVRELLASLRPELRIGISQVWTDDRQASFEVADPSMFAALTAELGDSPAATGFQDVAVRVGPSKEPVLMARDTPQRIKATGLSASRLLELESVKSLRLMPGTVAEIGLSEEPAERELRETASVLKRNLSDGDQIVLSLGTGAEVLFRAQTSLPAPNGDGEAHSLGVVFQDAWNA